MTTRKLRSSKRGLTFSVTPGAQYYPGSHYVYEVRKNCIIIRPAETGMKVSRKKTGLKEKALFDIRNKEVRDAVSSCSYMEMEVQDSYPVHPGNKEQNRFPGKNTGRVLFIKNYSVSSSGHRRTDLYR